ncbi:MAG: monovalent cation/H(+) antiporter subunit G [Actinomycetota bacterium]|jgi:monovalent cation/proton antiporter MnhG/PhaG subunit|nr:monovalent cation/H(+) antiporter subunit G [Actinomycetota bacterium]
MTVGDILVAVLLILGVGIELVCCLGVLVMRGVYDRLHYTGPASFGAVLIAAAVVIREGLLSQIGAKAVLIAVVLLVVSPVLVHATARAARLRERGELQAQPNEVEES